MKNIITAISTIIILSGVTLSAQNNPAPFINTNIPRGQNLRVLRLAVSCTGEYTQSVGDVATAKANMTAWLEEINKIYGREYSVRFELIPNNDMLIFPDPGADPWATMPPGSGGCDNNALILDNQGTIIDGIIGAANYDFSHVILDATFNGGCAGGFKTGYSGGFNIPVTRHEMGHQFNQPHTINNGGNNNYELLGGNWSIQGGNGQSYAHSSSYHNLAVHLQTTQAASGTQVPTGNTIPTINAGPDQVIPINTPFAITAISTDPDAGDQLTYAWDQLDGGIEQPSPVVDDTQGALFMRFLPVPQSTRTFPKTSDLLLGNYKTTEENLPTQPRDINFRVTVNDNHQFNYNGTVVPASGINSDDIKVTVVNNGGPFQVTSPNTAVTFAGGSQQNITWLVNGTNQNPINTTNVKISLSTDGGLTFPIVLSNSTPNDGMQLLTIPNIGTTQARVKIEAIGNIYFDISNQDFTITQNLNLPGLLTAITGNSTIVSELGQSDTYNLSLLTTPTGPVTVLIAADPQSEVSLDGISYANATTVTLSNTTPQVVTVRGKYDLITEGPHVGSISHSVTASTDNNYPVGLPGTPVGVAISDAQIPPVVGIDFDNPASTSVPNHWVKFVGMNNQTATNIPLDDGTPTSIDINITDTAPGQSFDFGHNSGNGNSPQHVQPLDQTLAGVSVSQGTVQITWSDLKPNTKYRIFVFAHNVVNGPSNQSITIMGNGSDNPTPFTQSVIGSIQVNDQTSMNQPLVSFAKEVSASATGTIGITIVGTSAANNNEIWLSGLAIQESLAAPTGGAVSGFTCADPIVITAAGTFNAPGPSQGNGASSQLNANGVATHANWYRFIPPTTGTITISSCGAANTHNHIFHNFNSCATVATDVENVTYTQDRGCQPDPNNTANGTLLTGIPVTAGTPIYIEWDDALSNNPFTWTLSYEGGGGCPTNVTVSTATTMGNTLASAAITTQGTVSANTAVFSAPMVNINDDFSVPAGQCFEVNNVGCAYTGTLTCDGGGNPGLGQGTGTCASPYVLTCGTPFMGDVTGGPNVWIEYSDGMANSSGEAYQGPERIHTLVIPAMTTRMITLSGFTNDMDFFVTSTCDDGTVISNNGAQEIDGVNEEATINNTTTSAMTVYIIVDGWDGDVGPYTLTCS